MAYADALAVNRSDIPIIDIARLRDNSDAKRVGHALRKASAEVGFLYVTNHGIDPKLIDQARAAAKTFFTFPLEQKQTIKVEGNHRGFIPIGQAFMTEDAKKDLKESFVWGAELATGARLLAGDNPVPPKNRWPDFMPKLQPTLNAYFDAAQTCAIELMRGFALGFDMPPDTFLKATDRPISRAAITYYPPQPPDLGEEQFGVAPHTDYGCLTVLAQDDVGGLQVQRSDGAWVAAPPIADTLVINVGDLLARWTNDALRSTLHRVVNKSGRERYSLVLAYDPNYETLINPSAFAQEGSEALHSPISCGDYIEARLNRSFKYRQGDDS